MISPETPWLPSGPTLTWWEQWMDTNGNFKSCTFLRRILIPRICRNMNYENLKQFYKMWLPSLYFLLFHDFMKKTWTLSNFGVRFFQEIDRFSFLFIKDMKIQQVSYFPGECLNIWVNVSISWEDSTFCYDIDFESNCQMFATCSILSLSELQNHVLHTWGASF